MMENLPIYLPAIFLFSTLFCLSIIFWILKGAVKEGQGDNSWKLIVGIIIWLALQAVLSINNTYSLDTNSIPPKIFLFGILPLILLYAWLLISNAGTKFIDKLSIEKLTFLHLVRIPIEIGLFSLYFHKAIPEILTFEGWNFDIIMGLTAPLIIYFGFKKGSLSKTILLLWNMIGVVLLLLVFVLAILSSPFPLQQLAFDQPNVGLLHFPYSLLPTFIVPVVILAHLISIRQLLKSE